MQLNYIILLSGKKTIKREKENKEMMRQAREYDESS